MAYDTKRQRLVLYGGGVEIAQGGEVDWGNQIFEWDGAGWVQQQPVTQVPLMYSPSMAYNPTTEELLIFGFTQFGEQTWVWDGKNFYQKMPATTPPARQDQAMVYDIAHNDIVMFGGALYASGGAILNDTWEWLTPNVSLAPQAPSITKSGGNYVVTLNLANQGNVPDTTVLLSSVTLGSVTTIGGGFLADINPGTTGTITLNFKASSVGTGVKQLTYSGTYNANGVVGIPFSASTFVFLP